MRGLKRAAVATVDGFAAAASLAWGSDLTATIPEKHTAALHHGMYSFDVPLPVEPFTISLLWHSRLDGDPAHRWLRESISATCSGDESDKSE